MKMQRRAGAIVSFFLFLSTSTVLADGLQSLHGHVPPVIAQLRPLEEYPQTNRLHLAISLPLRNQAALSNLLAQIYNPASPNYRHYLTPEQFTAEFGPSEQDYQAVKAFANSNGLRVTMTYTNRVLVDVEGSVGDIQRALHTTLNVYRHPTENRNFYAPTTEPSLDLSVPVLHVGGLDNYSLPRPNMVAKPLVKGQKASPNNGSGPDFTYMGGDFRAAYAPGVSLNGMGQSVGLMEFDGYSTGDINSYESMAGLPDVPLENVLVDGVTNTPSSPGGADVEVALDIEMAISMATNLSRVVVYIAPDTSPFEDILNQMVTNTAIKQFSCSWYIPDGPADPAADQIWEQMAAQGQSFFSASGDGDAYTGLISFPGDSPYITQVGGTTLSTTGPGGAWVSETVWNWGGGTGSGGGISTQYPIPSWQVNINMATNQGSTTLRNTPDVALTADNIFVFVDGFDYFVGGTSCAAPLWAGFAALVNQQTAALGRPSIGFINPAVDAIGTTAGYTSAFHDITNGDNTSSGSTNRFYAVPGYDLCTGWGTPNGQTLINAFTYPEVLNVTPDTGFTATGGVGGPFTVMSEELSLTNIGTNALTWSLSNTSAWLTVSSDGGVLTPGGPATTVTVSLNTTASNLVVGTYSATLWITNLNDHFQQGVLYVLNVIAPPTITSQPASQAVPEGASATFTVEATGGMPFSYQWRFDGTNLIDGGDISGSQTSSLTVSDVLPANVGNYSVILTNLAGVAVSSNASLTIMPSAPVILIQPTNQTAVQEQTVVFNVGVAGTPPFTYQWSFGGTNIEDATNASLTLTNVQLTQAGSYSVTVANSLGSTASSNAVLTLYPIGYALFFDDFSGSVLNPIWQTNLPDAYCGSFPGPGPPQVATYIGAPNYTFGLLDSNTVLSMTNVIGPDQRVGWGSSTNFVAVNFRYEARFNTEILSSTTSIDGFFEIWIMNATNENLYDIVSPFAGNYGSQLYMFFGSSVDNNYKTSSYAFADDTWYRLVLQSLPGQNIRASLCDDNDNELIGYTFGHDGTAFGSGFKIVISEAVGPVLNFPTAAAVDYVRLSTQFVPVIIEQPQSQAISENETASLHVTVEGAPPFNYQWNFNGTNIGGATNSTLTITDYQPENAGVYSVMATNAYGSVISSNAFLTTDTRPPTITDQPTNESVVVGGTVTLSVTVVGALPLIYNWSFNGANIPGATNSTLTLTDVEASQAGNYSVFISNAYGSTNSSVATLTVYGIPPSITFFQTIPTIQRVMAGGNATISMGANGSQPLSCQWSFNGTTIAGATNTTLTLTDLQTNQTGNYTVTVSNGYGSTNASATLTVFPIVTEQFFDDFGGPSLNPIWQTNLPAIAIAGSYGLANNPKTAAYIGAPNYNFGLLDSNTVLNLHNSIGPQERVGWSSSTNFPPDTFRYEARFNTEFLSSTTSVDGFLEIWLMNATNDNVYYMASTYVAKSNTVPYMFFASTSVNAFGSTETFPFTFADNTWYRLALESLPGQYIRISLCDDNERELFGDSPLALDASVFSSGFKIVIAQSVGSESNAPTSVALDYVRLTSQLSPSIIDQPQNQVVLPGTNAAFSVVAEGPPPLSYQWTFDGGDIVGATNAILTLTNVESANQGPYSVLVTNSYGSVLSSNAMLTVTVPPPSLTISPEFGVLFISWPTANSAGFTLVTSTNLESGSWAPVSPAPTQEGTEYYEVVSPTGNEAFYRLQYTGN